jgi:hypothetical protein
MPRLCRGEFSQETKRILQADDGLGIALLSQPCSVCGSHVAAENKAGEWVPKIHPTPAKRRPLKDGGRKR